MRLDPVRQGFRQVTVRHSQRGDYCLTLCALCNERGHIALRCPKNALVVKESDEEGGENHGVVGEIVVRGKVDGQEVDDILVDTGCARTLVLKSLVVPSKLTGGEMSVRCAHGDVSRYPIAEVKITIQGESHVVRVGVAEKLPRSVLLGRDVQATFRLLQPTKCSVDSFVMTRAQARKEQQGPYSLR